MNEPIGRMLAVDAVAARLRRRVLAGEVPAGERFPSEREMAETYGVNRLTLRQAVARLVAQGLVTVRQGDGIRATDYLRSGTLDVLADLFIAVRESPRVVSVVRDLLELQRVAAGEVAALAAERRTDADLARISARIDALEAIAQPGAARREVARAEIEVSREIVLASHNVAFELLLNTVHRFVEQFPEVLEGGAPPPEMLPLMYRALLELIRARDADGARGATRAALEAAHAETVARFAAEHGGAKGAARKGAKK